MSVRLSPPASVAARRRMALSAAAATLLVASPAAAQQAPDADTQRLEDISVEGQGGGDGSAPAARLKRRTEAASRLGLTVRETPATVDVLTQDKLQEEGRRSLIEAYGSAPGVVSGNLPGEPGVTAIRGFSRGAVGYMVDGVRAIDPLIASRNYDSYSFDRIEILKGPASVVNGSGALAGTINLVTRKPEFDVFKPDGLLSYGSFDTVRAGAAVNAPISENVAASTSVLYGRSNGFIDDTDSENVQVTTGIALKPTDRLKITAAFDYFRDDFRTAYFGTPLVPSADARNPSDIVKGGGLVLDRSIRGKNYNVDDGVMKSDAIWARTGAEYELSDQWTLKNDLAYYTADRLWRNSEQYTYNAATKQIDRDATFITHDHQSWTNRTTANFDGEIAGLRNRFTAGFEYMRTDFGSKRRFGATPPVDPDNPDRGNFPDDMSGFGTRQNFDSTVKNSALFAENALNLTPDWIVVGGLRRDWIDLDRRIDDLNAAVQLDPFGNKYDATSWRIGTVYDLSPQVSLFGQYTTAITPVSALVLSSASRAEFDLTKGRSVEAGVKTLLWDERIVATASVYQIDQDNILTRNPVNAKETVQGGSQRSRGVELDVSVAITDRWKLNANAAILRAEFTKLREPNPNDPNDPNGVSLKGNRPLNVPERTFNLWTTYRLAEAPITLGAGVRHVGSFYTDNANTIRVAGRTLLDASISVDVPAGGVVTLRGRNLTNKLYAEWSGYSSTQVYLGAPRSFDLTYSVKF